IAADSTAYSWDGSGKLIRKYTFPEAIKGFDQSTQRRMVLLWGAHEVVLLTEAGEDLRLKGPPGELIQAGFSPNGDYLLLTTWQDHLTHSLPDPNPVIHQAN